MDLMEKLVSLAKRRGFIFPSSEIYGGLNGAWDYGPLGVELKRNIKDSWWRDMVTAHKAMNINNDEFVAVLDDAVALRFDRAVGEPETRRQVVGHRGRQRAQLGQPVLA